MSIRIRRATPSDASGIARVHVNSWRTTYAGLVPQDYLNELSRASREATWEESLSIAVPGKSHHVAETENGEIVGFSVAGLASENGSDFKGEIYAIYLLSDFQRLGVGRSLFLASCNSLLDAGISSMLLWVLEENHGARHFYESLKGEVVRTKNVNIGGADLVEVAYGWQDITPFIS